MDHVIPDEPLQLKENLMYMEEAIRILERRDPTLLTRTIPYVKVLWKHHKSADVTWEPEVDMRRSTHVYSPQVSEISRTKFLKGGKNF